MGEGTDCHELVAGVQNEASSRASWSSIVADIKGASSLLPMWEITKVMRSRNRIAHELARLAMLSKESKVCGSSTPTTTCYCFSSVRGHYYKTMSKIVPF